MGKKGRRGRSKVDARKGAVRPSDRLPVPAPVVTLGTAASAPAQSTDAQAERATSSSPAAEPEREPDATPPPVGDLDTRFFAESPSEAWLAHELERRDPQLLRKMTAKVAQRRAHLSRYVVGVVGVAVVLCLAALIKSAVPADDDAPQPRPGAQMPMPAAQPAPLPFPSAARTPEAPPAASPKAPLGTDGGG